MAAFRVPGGLHCRFLHLQIVHALGLFPGGHILVLGPHVLNLRQLQGAVFLALRQGAAGDVGMDMDFKGLVVLSNDQAVPDAVEIGPEGLQIHVGIIFADNKHRIEGKGDLLCGEDLKVGLGLLGLLLGGLRHGLAPELRQHPLQNQQIALAAGVHHPGLFQHRVHVRGLGQGLVALLNGGLQHFFKVCLLGGPLRRPHGGQAGHGEDGALGGLHDGLVGGGHALLHGGGEFGGPGALIALQALGEPPEEQGENDAGISPGAPEKGRGCDGYSLVQGGGLGLAELRHGGADGHGHIGARVPVGDGEDVQVVDGLFLGCDGGGAVENHPLEQPAGNLFIHSLSSSLTGSWSPRTRPRPEP